MWLLCVLCAFAAEISGTYTLSSTPAEVRSSIDAGVEASVRDLPPMFRGTARSRLSQAAEVCSRYAFELSDEALRWQCDGKEPVVVPRASFGKAVRVQRDGKVVSMTVSVTGDAVQVKIDGEDGQRTAAFTFTDGALVARSSVKGAQLSVPMRWEAKYARAVAPTP